MFTDSFPWALIWLLILAYAFGLFDWIDQRVRNFERRSKKTLKQNPPSLSEILAMIRDTHPRTRFEEGSDRYVRRVVRVRWPEKYWTRS